MSLLKSLDDTLLHTHRVLTHPTGPDALLSTTYYTLCLLHSQLTSLLSRKYTALAESIAKNASKTLLPGETLVATIEAPHLRLTELCKSVRSAGDVVEDVRLCARLGAWIGFYVEGKKAVWGKQHRDPSVKVLTYLKFALKVAYLGAENVAFLVKRGVLRGKWEGREEGLWKASARFWLAYSVVEILRLGRVRQLGYRKEFGAEKMMEVDGVVQMQSKKLEQKWWRDLYSILGWLPAVIHWSIGGEEKSPVGESVIGLGGMVPGLIALREAWRDTAQRYAA